MQRRYTQWVYLKTMHLWFQIMSSHLRQFITHCSVIWMQCVARPNESPIHLSYSLHCSIRTPFFSPNFKLKTMYFCSVCKISHRWIYSLSFTLQFVWNFYCGIFEKFKHLRNTGVPLVENVRKKRSDKRTNIGKKGESIERKKKSNLD